MRKSTSPVQEQPLAVRSLACKEISSLATIPNVQRLHRGYVITGFRGSFFRGSDCRPAQISLVSGYFMTTLLFKISFTLCVLSVKEFFFVEKQPFDDNIFIKNKIENLTDTNQLIGQWNYSNTIWYHSELTFEKNGTFTFHDQGCYGQEFTKGKWIFKNDTICLQSFDTFKDIPDRPLPKSKMKKRKTKSGDIIYSYSFDKPFLPTAKDTIKVYFSNIRLVIKSDTLYNIDKNKFIYESKFTKEKNNR
jgi:hypothetical protein